jgi:hypothetical protein
MCYDDNFTTVLQKWQAVAINICVAARIARFVVGVRGLSFGGRLNDGTVELPSTFVQTSGASIMSLARVSPRACPPASLDWPSSSVRMLNNVPIYIYRYRFYSFRIASGRIGLLYLVLPLRSPLQLATTIHWSNRIPSYSSMRTSFVVIRNRFLAKRDATRGLQLLLPGYWTIHYAVSTHVHTDTHPLAHTQSQADQSK